MKNIFNIYSIKTSQASPLAPPPGAAPPLAGGAVPMPGAVESRSGTLRGIDSSKIEENVSSENFIDKINAHIAAYLDHLPEDYVANSDKILDHALAAALMAEGSRFPVNSAHWDLSTYPPRVLGFDTLDLGPAVPAAPAPPPGMM